MEIKTVETKSFRDVYVAVDGTEFDSVDECRKYEKSAVGVIRARLHKLAILESSPCDLLNGDGSDETTTYTIVPKTEDDINLIRQALCMNQNQANRIAFDEIDRIGHVLMVNCGYEDWFYVTDLCEVIEHATLGKYKASIVEVQ